MRVYVDNVAASGRVVGDLAPASEMEALRDIERAASAGLLKMVTSRRVLAGAGANQRPREACQARGSSK